jgi:uncharacterized Zn-binding protein involved in type VI secretion
MPPVARADGTDTVFSPDGAGPGKPQCRLPLNTNTGTATVTNVRVEGIAPVVQGDLPAPHNRTGCIPDTQPLSTYSSKVFVNGKPIGRIGDNYGDNIITSGSTKVFAG